MPETFNTPGLSFPQPSGVKPVAGSIYRIHLCRYDVWRSGDSCGFCGPNVSGSAIWEARKAPRKIRLGVSHLFNLSVDLVSIALILWWICKDYPPTKPS